MSLVLKEIRKKYSLSQADFAKKLDVSRSAIAQIELGKNNISMPLAKKISKLFKVSIDSLINNNHSDLVFELHEESPIEDFYDSIYMTVTNLILDIDKIEIAIITIQEFADEKNINKEFVLANVREFERSINYYALINDFKEKNRNDTLTSKFIRKVESAVERQLSNVLNALYNTVSINYNSLGKYYKKKSN